MTVFQRTLLFVSLGFFLNACATQSKQVVFDQAFFTAMVAERYVEPFKKGDLDAWLEAFAEHALALHNRRPMDEGKAAIAEFGRAVHTNFDIRQFDVTVSHVRHHGDWAYTSGLYTSHFVSKADGSSPFGVGQGKFLLVWERQADGEWKIILDMGNSNS